MRLAISQSYFFPYIGYFQLIRAVDKFIIYDHVTYIKGGWIQRNRIADPNATDSFIIVPLKKRSPNKLICELPISYDSPWQRKIIKQLRQAYSKSPFFHELFPFFQNLLTRDFRSISELNHHTIKAVAQLLDIQTIITYGQSIEEEVKGKRWPYATKTQRIFLACQQERADTYINAPGGQALYSKEEFKEQNIELFFIQPEKYIYTEGQKKPMPYLSIIDVLFNFGVEETKKLLTCYELI